MMEQSYKVYVEVLIKTLQEKSECLEDVMEFNSRQELLVKSNELDMDHFDALLANKQLLLEEIERLDQIFESTYERVKEELLQNKTLYRSEIETIQQWIKKLTEQSVQIKLAEQRIKVGVERSFRTIRQKVKVFNTNSKTANQYYKNMANQHMGQSYFLDRKK